MVEGRLPFAVAPGLWNCVACGGSGLASVLCDGAMVAIVDALAVQELGVGKAPVVALVAFAPSAPPVCQDWAANLLAVGHGRHVGLFDADTGFPRVDTISVVFEVKAVALTAMGGGRYTVALGGCNGVEVHGYPPVAEQSPVSVLHSFAIATLAFSPSGALLAIAAADGHVGLWETAVFRSDTFPAAWHGEMQETAARVTSVAVAHDDTLVAFATWDGAVRLVGSTGATWGDVGRVPPPATPSPSPSALIPGGTYVAWGPSGDADDGARRLAVACGAAKTCQVLRLTLGDGVVVCGGEPTPMPGAVAGLASHAPRGSVGDARWPAAHCPPSVVAVSTPKHVVAFGWAGPPPPPPAPPALPPMSVSPESGFEATVEGVATSTPLPPRLSACSDLALHSCPSSSASIFAAVVCPKPSSPVALSDSQCSTAVAVARALEAAAATQPAAVVIGHTEAELRVTCHDTDLPPGVRIGHHGDVFGLHALLPTDVSVDGVIEFRCTTHAACDNRWAFATSTGVWTVGPAAVRCAVVP